MIVHSARRLHCVKRHAALLLSIRVAGKAVALQHRPRVLRKVGSRRRDHARPKRGNRKKAGRANWGEARRHDSGKRARQLPKTRSLANSDVRPDPTQITLWPAARGLLLA